MWIRVGVWARSNKHIHTITQQAQPVMGQAPLQNEHWIRKIDKACVKDVSVC